MAQNLSDSQLAVYRETFKIFDKDQNGLITTDELHDAMSALGQILTKQDAQDMIAEVDSDGDGAVNFTEFLTLITNKMKEGDTEEEMEHIFKMMDKDGDGKIDATELEMAMGRIADSLGKDEILGMLNQADLDGDGKINFHEFKLLMETK